MVALFCNILLIFCAFIFTIEFCECNTYLINNSSFATDFYGDKTSLFYYKQNVTINCVSYTGCDTYKRVIMRNATTIVYKGEPGNGEQNLPFVVGENDIGNKFDCFCDDTAWNKLWLNYSLCDEYSDECRTSECSSIGSNSNLFCIKKSRGLVEQCKKLEISDCVYRFGFTIVGMACVVGETNGVTLCEAFADDRKPVIKTTTEPYCNTSTFTIQTDDDNETLFVGTIRPFSGKFKIDCSIPGCLVQCKEVDNRREIVDVSQSISDGGSYLLRNNIEKSMITKITCTAEQKATIYAFNVRINTDITLRMNDNQLECKLTNTPEDKRFNWTFSWQLDNATQTSTDSFLNVTTCGANYTCIINVTAKNCNPWYSGYSVGFKSLYIDDDCKPIPDNDDDKADFQNEIIYIIIGIIAILIIICIGIITGMIFYFAFGSCQKKKTAQSHVSAPKRTIRKFSARANNSITAKSINRTVAANVSSKSVSMDNKFATKPRVGKSVAAKSIATKSRASKSILNKSVTKK